MILTAPVSVPTLLVAAGVGATTAAVAGGAVTVAAVGVAAAGAATTVIGGSEVAEGGQDVVFGALGSDTSSVNVVRDFGFGGDEAAYNQAKGIVTTTASVGTMVLAPVAQTVSAASGGTRPEKADSTKQTKTTGNTGGNATAGKTATAGTTGKSTTSAMKLKSGETDAVGQTKTAANAGTRIKIERYGTLKKDKSIPGQSHHLNQDAAYKNVIPKDEGMAIKLKGNILTQKNSPHYKAHKSLEEFWNRFREGGVREHEVPTNREYTKALYKSLQDAGISKDQALEAVKAAIRQRRDYGLTGGMEVPAVPKKIHGL